MLVKKIFLTLLWFLLAGFSVSANSESALKPFVSGSYQQILTNNAKQPFMLAVWSVDCSSCIKDMTLLNEIHKKNPKLKVILLAADELSASDQVKQILAKYQLEEVENWIFADENSQKLRFEIDPKWYGELPRTYFFDVAHQRNAKSGVMTKKDYQEILAKIMK